MFLARRAKDTGEAFQPFDTDADYPRYEDVDRPVYVGTTTFGKRPLVEDPAALHARAPDAAIVGAPFDDAVTHRPGARFGPRAIRDGTYQVGAQSLQLDIDAWRYLDVVDGGDADVVPAWLERAHAMIFEKVRDVLEEALGADEDEITPEASLTADLEAESIDFLDIVFRLEKSFSTDDAPFKILQGEYCGQCHGAVAFPLTQCLRCHSVSRRRLRELER